MFCFFWPILCNCVRANGCFYFFLIILSYSCLLLSLKRIFLASDDYEIVNRLVEYFDKEKLVCSFFSGLFHSMTLNKQAETRAVNNKWSATKTSNGLVVHFQNNVSLQTLHLWVPPMVYQLLHFFWLVNTWKTKTDFWSAFFLFQSRAARRSTIFHE